MKNKEDKYQLEKHKRNSRATLLQDELKLENKVETNSTNHNSNIKEVAKTKQSSIASSIKSKKKEEELSERLLNDTNNTNTVSIRKSISKYSNIDNKQNVNKIKDSENFKQTKNSDLRESYSMKKNDLSQSQNKAKEELEQKGLSLLDETQEDFATEVFDEADIANAIEMNNIQAAIRRNKEKLAKESHPDFDGENCIDCGEPIHKVRLELGKIRCFDCQTELEKRSKMFR